MAVPVAVADGAAPAGAPGPFVSPCGAALGLLEGDAGATFGFGGTPTLWTEQREQEGVAGALRAGCIVKGFQGLIGSGGAALGMPAGDAGASFGSGGTPMLWTEQHEQEGMAVPQIRKWLVVSGSNSSS